MIQTLKLLIKLSKEKKEIEEETKIELEFIDEKRCLYNDEGMCKNFNQEGTLKIEGKTLKAKVIKTFSSYDCLLHSQISAKTFQLPLKPPPIVNPLQLIVRQPVTPSSCRILRM